MHPLQRRLNAAALIAAQDEPPQASALPQLAPLPTSESETTPVTRDNLGRFVKGVSGNQAGRPKGSRNRARLVAEFIEEALVGELADDAMEILEGAVQLAKDGDTDMIKFLLGDIIKRARGADADEPDEGAKGPRSVTISITHIHGQKAGTSGSDAIPGEFTTVEG